jgi:putative phosphoribosyl transferase
MGLISEEPRYRDRIRVFSDRYDAGKQLALSISRLQFADAVVWAIPAGGVPIGVELALMLRVPLMLAVVRKVQIPWNTEAGFGAVTWDERVHLNDRLLSGLGLSPAEIETAIEKAKRNVKERLSRFGAGKSFPDLTGKCAILVDDGLASGYTMLAAVDGLRALFPAEVMVAVPTGSADAVKRVAAVADRVICLNIRTGYRFAVAEAYKEWHDLSDEEVLVQLGRARDAGLY